MAKKSLWDKLTGWISPGHTESRRFGGYHIVKLIHEGEKASVHLGRAPEGDDLVAIKVFKPLYNRTARRIRKRYHLRSEGQIGMLINPRGKDDVADWPIIRTLGEGHEFGDPKACYYAIIEYVDGLNVKHLLGCEDPLLRQNRLKIAQTVAHALSIIHDRGLIHRDICMDNVMFTRDHRAKLIDLGFMAPAGIAFQERSGTPSYMAPEQFQAKPLNAAADIYSFGVLLFELFTGQLPFTSTFATGKPELAMRRASDLSQMHQKDAPPRPSEINERIPAGLEDVILCCMEKNPADRFADMKLVMAALARAEDPPSQAE